MRIDNYLIPINIIDYKRKSIVNLEKLRSEKISIKNLSVDKFQNDIRDIKSIYPDCDKRLLYYIREFPIIINNIELWNKILNLFNIEQNSDLRNISYFFLDFLFPISKKVINLINTSIYGEKEKLFNEIKKKYIKYNFGIESIDFIDYGKSEISRKIDIKYFEDTISKEEKKYLLRTSSNYLGVNIDFSDTILENFIKSNDKIIKFIHKLRKYIGIDRFDLSDTIILTIKDLKLIDAGDIGLVEGIEVTENNIENSIKLIQQFLNDIFKKEMLIHSTYQYTTKEVLWALKESNNPSKWDKYVGNSVPYWLIEVFGYPPPNLTSNPNPNYRINIIQGKSDKVLDFIKIITSKIPLNTY